MSSGIFLFNRGYWPTVKLSWLESKIIISKPVLTQKFSIVVCLMADMIDTGLYTLIRPER